MTRWMRPPELEPARELEQLDPVIEGERHGLSPGRSLTIWRRLCADATDRGGQLDLEQARRRFHELATRITTGGGRVRPEVGKATRVAGELDDATSEPRGTDELGSHTPGRETLLTVEARREHASAPPASRPGWMTGSPCSCPSSATPRCTKR
jgi:hypothetical protein